MLPFLSGGVVWGGCVCGGGGGMPHKKDLLKL